MDCKKIYQLWVKNVNDTELSGELHDIASDPKAIADRFYRELEFGTGGLRGVLGAGTNRMNIYTVAKATQGYCNYLKAQTKAPSVAIAYDSRIHSDTFAKKAAEVFAGNGITVYIYPKLMPTPSLSFAVRDLHCAGGVVVTASHNPAKYNGYKVYGADGCQITMEAANAIQKEIDAVDPFRNVKYCDFDPGLKDGKIAYIGEDTVERYLAAVGAQSLFPNEKQENISLVYTPLNGTGISCVPRCLREHGFSNMTIPVEQRDPNGRFPTCPYPNPEIREALQVGLACAKKNGSEMLLATDPDCDRVGVAVEDNGEYILINGNEMGVLLLDFICKMRIAKGTMPKEPIAVKTIVTTPMAAKVAEHYGVKLINVLTGFKYIGEQIGFLEKSGEADRYIFGFEESYGYLSGSFVRDKDAVNASLLICQMYAYYKARGKTLVDVLNKLYEEYGYYETRLKSFTFEGAVGFEKMQKLMADLRADQPAAFADFSVEKITDYLTESIDGLPKSNVIRFSLRDGSEAVIRPSGTEPKLKIYLTTTAQDKQKSMEKMETLDTYFQTWIKDN